jgi:RNA polymerase sigma factor FliA
MHQATVERHTPEDLRLEPGYALWARLRAGDRSVRDQLVERYAPLVKYVIARTSISLSATLDADDVLSAGTVGLLQAVDRYDPDQGVRFETFGLQRIRGAIVDAIRSVSPLSRGANRRARQLEDASAVLSQELGRPPTRAELAQTLNVSEPEISRLLVETRHVTVSIDGPGAQNDDDSTWTLRDLLTDPTEPSTADLVEERELVQRLGSAMDALPDRDRLLLTLHYRQEISLKEVSRVINVSEARASQLHAAAVNKLRTALPTTRVPALV